MAISVIGGATGGANRDDGATVQYTLNVSGGYTKKTFSVVTGVYSLKLFGNPSATGTYGLIGAGGGATGITTFTFPASGEYSVSLTLTGGTHTGIFIGLFTGSAVLRAWNQDGVDTTLTPPTWTQVTLASNPSNAWQRMVGNGNGGLVGCYPQPNSTQASFSTNGTNWTVTYPGQANQWYGWYGPWYVNGRWVLLDPSATGTNHYIRYTTDGTTWTSVAQGSNNNYFMNCIAYSNGAYLLTNMAGPSGVWRSTDLTNWTNYNIGYTVNSVAGNSSVAVAGANYSSSQYSYSTDGGSNWTTAYLPNGFSSAYGYVEWVGDRFIMYNQQNATLYWSTTGTGSWTAGNAATTPMVQNQQVFQKLGDMFFMTGSNGTTYYSTNLSSWTSSGAQISSGASYNGVLNGKIYRFQDYQTAYVAGANTLS